jgi:hypothetical protein
VHKREREREREMDDLPAVGPPPLVAQPVARRKGIDRHAHARTHTHPVPDGGDRRVAVGRTR